MTHQEALEGASLGRSGINPCLARFSQLLGPSAGLLVASRLQGFSREPSPAVRTEGSRSGDRPHYHSAALGASERN